MRPGPDRIVACPSCGAAARHITLLSGNTLGARVWTDGKQMAPMLPSPPEVVQCHACPTAYWLRSAKVVSGPDRAMSVGSDVPRVEEPSEQEYYDAIAAGLAKSAEEEVRLRVLAWWRANEELRSYEEGVLLPTRPLSQAFQENLEMLLSLLDDEQSHLLMRAEALRQLGRFDDAERVLREVDLEYEWAADQIVEHCRNRDTTVRPMELPGGPQNHR
jgi:hypothetical protein